MDHFAILTRPLNAGLKGIAFARECQKGQKLVIKDWDEKWSDLQRKSRQEQKESLCNPENFHGGDSGST